MTAGNVKPALTVDIPDVKFSDILVQDGYVDIPWLAEYISGAYKYSLAIGAFLAAVMMVIGGFIYLTAGDSGRTKQAKEYITNSILGLAVLLGSYVLLNTINPDLTKLDALRVQTAEREEFYASMMTTTEDTIGPNDTTSGGEIAGSHAPTFADCPIELTRAKTSSNPSKDERANEFFAKIETAITGQTITDKITQIADAASKCGVEFGSCGRTVGTIYALAGATSHECIDSKTDCNNWPNRSKQNISKSQMDIIIHAKCKTDEQITEMNSKEKAQWGENSTDCKTDKKEAKQMVYEKLKAEIPGYPDTWADSLQPGDWLIFYNGNSSYSAAHSVLFLGWGKDGKAQVIQGSYENQVKAGSVCIRSNCSAPAPIMRIFSPN